MGHCALLVDGPVTHGVLRGIIISTTGNQRQDTFRYILYEKHTSLCVMFSYLKKICIVLIHNYKRTYDQSN